MGQKVRIHGLPFTIVGTLASKVLTAMNHGPNADGAILCIARTARCHPAPIDGIGTLAPGDTSPSCGPHPPFKPERAVSRHTEWKARIPISERGVEASELMVGDRRIQRAKDGDMAAFESLHREHVGRTYALALRLLAEEAEAEDAVQEIWVRVWERLGSFNGESAFSTWLHRLATNLTLDHLRRRKRQNDRSSSLDHPEARTHSARPDRPGMRMDLERAIAGLPDGARTMFVLHEVEGFKCREVAELTGKAEGTVKAQLFRARKLLTEALTQ